MARRGQCLFSIYSGVFRKLLFCRVMKSVLAGEECLGSWTVNKYIPIANSLFLIRSADRTCCVYIDLNKPKQSICLQLFFFLDNAAICCFLISCQLQWWVTLDRHCLSSGGIILYILTKTDCKVNI